MPPPPAWSDLLNLLAPEGESPSPHAAPEVRLALRLRFPSEPLPDRLQALVQAVCDPAIAPRLASPEWDWLLERSSDEILPHAAQLIEAPHPLAQGVAVWALVTTKEHDEAV